MCLSWHGNQSGKQVKPIWSFEGEISWRTIPNPSDTVRYSLTVASNYTQSTRMVATHERGNQTFRDCCWLIGIPSTILPFVIYIYIYIYMYFFNKPWGFSHLSIQLGHDQYGLSAYLYSCSQSRPLAQTPPGCVHNAPCCLLSAMIVPRLPLAESLTCKALIRGPGWKALVNVAVYKFFIADTSIQNDLQLFHGNFESRLLETILHSSQHSFGVETAKWIVRSMNAFGICWWTFVILIQKLWAAVCFVYKFHCSSGIFSGFILEEELVREEYTVVLICWLYF